MKSTEQEIQEIIKRYKISPERLEEYLKSKELELDIQVNPKTLVRVPTDVDFEMKDGNTTYEVSGFFSPNGSEYFINQVIDNLGYKI